MPSTVTACVAGALLVAALSACGHDARASATQAVTVHVTDALRFEPATIRVHVGTVRLTLVDDGSYPHNLSVPASHTTSKSVNGDLGGQRSTVILRFPKPGTYPFVCTYHADAGMRGRIVVQS